MYSYGRVQPPAVLQALPQSERRAQACAPFRDDAPQNARLLRFPSSTPAHPRRKPDRAALYTAQPTRCLPPRNRNPAGSRPRHCRNCQTPQYPAARLQTHARRNSAPGCNLYNPHRTHGTNRLPHARAGGAASQKKQQQTNGKAGQYLPHPFHREFIFVDRHNDSLLICIT